MLAHLNIRDFLLIDSADIALAPGLNVLTGETGAGKSLLLEALALACGERADASMVRIGAKQARITAVFEMPHAHPVWQTLTHHGVVPDDVLVMGRVLEASGKSRAFLNDQPVTAALLKSVGQALVLVSGQFAAQDLLEPDKHRAALDSMAIPTETLQGTARAYAAWQEADIHEKALQLEYRTLQREEEYWRRTEEELAALNALPDEESQILEQRSTLSQRTKGAEAAESALGSLRPQELERTLRRVLRTFTAEGEAADRVRQQLDSASDALALAAQTLEELSSTAQQEQQERELLEDRLHALRAMARKYQVSGDGLSAFYEEAANRSQRQARFSEEYEAAKTTTAQAWQDFLQQALHLRTLRKAAADALAQQIQGELAALKMPKCRFMVRLEERREQEAAPHGLDSVVFWVQTSPGVPEAPLHKAASGGELSRLMLALRVVLHQSHPLLVFDEIDSGAGGAVAAAIGGRLARLGDKAQVLAITHSPQVAASGAVHWRIAKTSQDGHTTTTIRGLSPTERQEEIARMLAGEAVGTEAHAAAARLLKEARGG